uniref:Phospholipase B-like n=1 Tax=Noctiluca scintillans TaxID=2966 RepID=A0A7S0ZWI0_NOCSC
MAQGEHLCFFKWAVMLCLLSLCLLVRVRASAIFPSPPVQTENQKRLYAAQAANAKAASDAATPKLLRVFESAAFREELLECCRDLADLPAPEILSLLRADLRTAELAHSFPAVVQDSHDDVTIEELSKLDYFPNQWQVALMRDADCPVFFNMAEEGIFGMAPFKNESRPTWTEAAERLVYVALNARQLDHGSLSMFGPAGAIFSHTGAQNMVLIAPVDTGMYEMLCNDTANHHHHKHNLVACGDYWHHHTVGTLDDLDHIIFANFGLFTAEVNTTLEQEAGSLFRRSSFAGRYLGLPNETYIDAFKYPESNIVGAPRFPGGISLLVGSFRELFGTDSGRALQLLADSNSLPLVWSLGAAPWDPWKTHKEGTTFPGNQRILDPLASRNALNATFPTGAELEFEHFWAKVSIARSPNGTLPRVRTWWTAFAATQERVAPLTATSCEATDDICFGTNAITGVCLCRRDHQDEALVVLTA